MNTQNDLISATAAATDGTAPDSSRAAARLLEVAARNADELLGEATAEAASLVATARAEADQLAAASRAQAEGLTTSARAEADQLLAAARTEAERVQSELEEKRAAQTAEIARLELLEQEHRERMRRYLTQLLKQMEPTPAG
jgi:cell division septum initiation protein DivIVA